MSSHRDALDYIANLNARVRPLALAVHQTLAESNPCDSYVKTIYVGYDLEGEMVAALYGHSDHVEVALALPEDADSKLLVDAGHLTWRTLPVAALVRDRADLPEFARIGADACERVQTRNHDVLRDNDFFIRSKRERRSQQP